MKEAKAYIPIGMPVKSLEFLDSMPPRQTMLSY